METGVGIGFPQSALPPSSLAGVVGILSSDGGLSQLAYRFLTTPSPLIIGDGAVRVLSTGKDTSSGNSWLIHREPRRRQPLQAVVESVGESKMHLIFRRLHSQQL